MSKTQKQLGHLFAFGLLVGAVLAALVTFRTTPALAHLMPAPCDFTTGGGFVLTDAGDNLPSRA